MSTQEALKTLLIQIKNDNYRVDEGIDAYRTAIAMMRHIGDTDPELRDELIYETFSTWFFHGAFTDAQMRNLLDICLDEQHLFYNIGEENMDSVFTRSFSVLIIPLLFMANRKRRFLTKADVLNIKDKVLKYLEQEKDLRGYVESKGWADARAHMADALEDIAKSEHIGEGDLIELLSAIKRKVSVRESACVCDEDERFVSAFMSIFERKLLKASEILNWLNDFRMMEGTGIMPSDLFVRVNNKCFLRSLYFRLLPLEGTNVFTEAIKEILLEVYHF